MLVVVRFVCIGCVFCESCVLFGRALLHCGKRVFCHFFNDKRVFLSVEDFCVVVDVCLVCGGGVLGRDSCFRVWRTSALR